MMSSSIQVFVSVVIALEHLPISSHCGTSFDHDPSSSQVNVAFPTKIWLVAHSMAVVVSGGEAAQVPFVDPSTIKAGHLTGSEEK